jgi:hypothetical protein
MTVRFSVSASIRFCVAGIALAALPSAGLAQDRRAAASSPESMTVVGCVARSADYVRTTAPADGAAQLLLTDVRSGSPTYNVTGLREQELMSLVGQRVEITGTLERARTTPVVTTAEGAVTGSVNSERPPAAGVTPDGAAAHEPSDALAATVPTGRVSTPARVSDSAYLVATLPGLNAASLRRVAGACPPPPAVGSQPAAATASPGEQRPVSPAPSQQRARAERLEPITARGCLVRQTPGGTALTPQSSPSDVLVLADASLLAAPVNGARGAVPGSTPGDSGSGTVPAPAATGGQAPVDAGTAAFTLFLSSADVRELVQQHVGDRVEVTGMLVASAGNETADPRRIAAQPEAAGAGRVQVAPVEVAHVSTPARGIAVTAVRPLGGACN